MNINKIEIRGDGNLQEGIMAYKWNLYIDGQKIHRVESLNLEIHGGDIARLGIVIRGPHLKVEGPLFTKIISEKE